LQRIVGVEVDEQEVGAGWEGDGGSDFCGFAGLYIDFFGWAEQLGNVRVDHLEAGIWISTGSKRVGQFETSEFLGGMKLE